MKRILRPFWLILAFGAAACGSDLESVGRAPDFTSIGAASRNAQPILTPERAAIAVPPPQPARYAYQQASLWNTGADGLLGDKRARNLGDLLTVVIEIDDRAEMRNTTSRSRSGSQEAGVTALFGLGRATGDDGESLSPNVELESESDFDGNGTVRRNEKLMLRVAATVVNVLPNGQLVIQGDQEVRVNYELRDLQVSGIVRPSDISRYNEIPYDRIAGARINYGGRGQLTSAQQPRYGQQILDQVMPF